MSSLNANKSDFAFWTEFYNDEGNGTDCFSWASNKAYLDMNRTMTFKETPQNNTPKDTVAKTRKDWRDSGTKAIREKFDEMSGRFEDWHKERCADLIRIYNGELVLREGGKRTDKTATLTYGQAQKWLNMTLKYLWLLNRLGMIEDSSISDVITNCQDEFHVPLDSYILRYVAKQDKNKKDKLSPPDNALDSSIDFSSFWKDFGSAWSQINDKDRYYKYQKELADAIKEGIPLEWELEHWRKAVKYYD